MTQELVYCSFCGKHDEEVKLMIAAHGAAICNCCVDQCNEVIEERLMAPEREYESWIKALEESRTLRKPVPAQWWQREAEAV